MITESTFIEPSTATMVATDQNTDFTNCENKSETLNVVTNGSYSFRSNSKLNNNTNNETENELNDYDNADTEDLNDYSRPKKLQKSLTGNNIINQLDCDYNLKSSSTTAKSSTNNSQLRQSSNKLLINNDSNQTDAEHQQLNTQTINQPTTITRRKQNLIDNNEYEDNFECLISKDNSSSNSDNNSLSSNLFNSPKVPPLRIVISSSTSSRNSKDVNQNSNNYVVSTSIESSSNGNVNENNKKDSTDNFYLTRSSNNQSSLSSTNNTQSSTIGRITTRSRATAAALNHLSNDDSQSRYSPEEFTNDQQQFNMTSSDQQPSETQSIYLNSQNLKEKESNKENKDLRRRKGRGKVQSSVITNTTTTASTSTNSTATNLINNNLNSTTSSVTSTSINSQQLIENNSQLSIDDQLLTSSLNQSMISLPPTGVNSRDYQMPAHNCYNMFQNIRKQVEKRRQNMCDSANSKSNQKAPQGFKNYLLTTGNYLLESRSESERNVNPNLTIEQINVPELLTNLDNTEQLIELYKEQELEREKMKVQHLVEREKVKLSIEQEILRVHNRASLAMHNQSLPLSFTVLMRDEEIYNPIDQETEHSFDGRNLESTSNQKENSTIAKNEYSRVTYSCTTNNTFADLFTLTGKSEDIGSRCRFSGRLLHSWLQDVEDKWCKIKKEILNRQRRESESLQARQRLEFEWKIKELSKKLKINLEEDKNTEKFNKKQWSDDLLLSDELIPLCKVNEEFDFS